MTKKCLGCGIVMQDKSPYTLGYTPKLENDYCERCFKITHYNAKIDVSLKISNEELLKKINSSHSFVFFLVDFLNIYEEVIDIYKRIIGPKMMVITKSDIIPKNIKKEKVVKNLKDVYDIKEDIILCSVKTKENLNSILKRIEENTSCIMAGFTNSGKSSLINHLLGANITVSKNSNTTLDFIKLKVNEQIIYDVPGFVPTSFIDSMTPKGYIKPISYQLKNKYCLKFLNIILASDIDNNLTLYLNNIVNVEKRKKDFNSLNKIKVHKNEDVIIKGLGFINVKKDCIIEFNIDPNLLETRGTIVGGLNE